MAKGRKPAITGVARPEGFLDDIVRPVIQKGAKVVKSKVWVNQVGKKGKDSARVIEGRLFRTADKIEHTMRAKRATNYATKSAVQKDKATAAYKKAMNTAGSTKKANALQKKADINAAKAKGAKLGGGYWTEPRQARKQVEYNYKMAKRAAKRK